jgi:haloalkane dehalogenase
MAYVDEGDGDPILFLRGQPTSSYLWRKIMLFMENKGRIIAPDNIGFGNSAQPAIDHTFLDHYAYFEAFVEELELENVTLVTHDWGTSLGLHYAARNPENVKGIVTMEALLAPILPAESFEERPEDLGNSDNGRHFQNQDNAWLSAGGNLQGVKDQALAVKALRTCLAPFQTVQSRNQVNQRPNEFLIVGDPAATTRIIDAYNKFMETTEIPWLFLSASPATAAEYRVGRARNIETVYIGHSLDYVEEDQPFAIGRAISVWYRRLEAE